jgi:hypothetical protein
VRRDGTRSTGDGEGLLHRVLGDVDVPEDTDQGRHRPAGLLPEDPAHHDVIDDRQPQVAVPGSSANAANGRTSIGT